MTQAHEDVSPGAAGGDSGVDVSTASNPKPFEGWLVLAAPDGPIDLPQLFPEVDVRIEASSEEFSEILSLTEPRLVVLIAPPAGPGDLQRVASWLGANPGSFAILLSPHQAVAVRLHALELGFEDAVDLSSDPMELVGRLSIAGRRGPLGSRLLGDRIPVGQGVELDRLARAIRRDGRLMWLRPKELALLEFLAMHPGRAFSREELMRHVWHEAVGNERTVDVYVFWLRSKIEQDAANPVHLLTVRGSGYLFDPPRPAPTTGATESFDPANVNEGPTQR